MVPSLWSAPNSVSMSTTRLIFSLLLVVTGSTHVPSLKASLFNSTDFVIWSMSLLPTTVSHLFLSRYSLVLLCVFFFARSIIYIDIYYLAFCRQTLLYLLPSWLREGIFSRKILLLLVYVIPYISGDWQSELAQRTWILFWRISWKPIHPIHHHHHHYHHLNRIYLKNFDYIKILSLCKGVLELIINWSHIHLVALV